MQFWFETTYSTFVYDTCRFILEFNMYDKLVERNSTENDVCNLLPSSEDVTNDEFSTKSKTSSYLSHGVRLITFERFLILLLLASLFFCLRRIISQHDQCAVGTETAGTNILTYGFNGQYMTLNHSNDHLWEDLVPLGEPRGVIWSGDGNDEGIETPGAISMFHQLHCLTSFRIALQNSTEGRDIGQDWHDDPHWPHCFNYLRNASNISLCADNC
jgi:hypothetical protein